MLVIMADRVSDGGEDREVRQAALDGNEDFDSQEVSNAYEADGGCAVPEQLNNLQVLF